MKKEEMEEIKSEPRIVKSHDVTLDAEYAEWIAEVKHRYSSAQVKAAVRVNSEKLLFNWQLGRDLVMKKAEERWGNGVVEQVSLDLKREFPNEDGFSTSNLWYMKKWYLFYSNDADTEKLQRLVGELQASINQERIKLQRPIGEIVKQPVSEIWNTTSTNFPLPFALVPWGQHIEIVSRSKSIEEAVFYINQVIANGLSRTALVNCFKARLYETQGKIVNNFSEHMPEIQSKLVQEVLKENYDFGFATVDHEIYNEDDLEEALTRNITGLLLELGTGFALIGRQKQLWAGDTTRKIDLLFYHIRLRCYVVCELKAKAFEPEFAGKLNFYVNAVDDLLKDKEDNPTIGLLICSDMNKAEVQWSFRGISTPIGVATYNNIRIKDALPTQEQLKERMELLQREMRATKRLMKGRKK
jgi:predicted nuclease of restriction endonuclease-like (RecB) superfamily